MIDKFYQVLDKLDLEVTETEMLIRLWNEYHEDIFLWN